MVLGPAEVDLGQAGVDLLRYLLRSYPVRLLVAPLNVQAAITPEPPPTSRSCRMFENSGPLQVDGVPEDDGGDREVEAGGRVALIRRCGPGSRCDDEKTLHGRARFWPGPC
jgi:hypothetical protein